MADLGRAALFVSLGLALSATVVGAPAAPRPPPALVRHDFSFVYVAQHTSTELPTGYSMSAFWGGQEGSLLLWLLVLSAYAAAAVLLNRRRAPDLDAWRVPVLGAVSTFFAFMLVAVSSPFDTQTAVAE